jgi:26S proteasome regulatory subunit N7
MPVENFEEEGLAKNPDLQLAQWKYMLSTDTYKNDNTIKSQLLEAIKAGGKQSALSPQ